MTEHRDQRHHAGPPAEQEDRAAVLDRPDEVPADRTAELDRVTRLCDIVEEGRDFAVLEALDRELERNVVARRGGNRVRALGLVAVRRRQPHVDMLAGAEGERLCGCEGEALDAGAELLDRDDPRLLPVELRLSHP